MSFASKQRFLTALKMFSGIGLVILIALTLVVLSRLSAQAKVAQVQAKATHDDTVASTTRIEDDLNCLGRFFSQTNRTDLHILSLSNCKIVNSASGSTYILTGTPPDTAKQPTSSKSTAGTQQPITAQTKPSTKSTKPTPTTSGAPDPSITTGITPLDELLNKIGL